MVITSYYMLYSRSHYVILYVVSCFSYVTLRFTILDYVMSYYIIFCSRLNAISSGCRLFHGIAC